MGFLAGYDVTYDADATSDSLEVTVLRFANATGAARMAAIANAGVVDPQEKPTRAAARGIPDSIAIDGTAPDSDGTYDHAILARKGTTVMVLTLYTDHGGGTPANLLQWATEQYSRL
jgi:hypothetical protein